MLKNKILYLILALSTVFLFSGCKQKEVEVEKIRQIPSKIHQIPSDSSLAKETKLNENDVLIGEAVAYKKVKKVFQKKVILPPDTDKDSIPETQEFFVYDPEQKKDVSVEGRLVEYGVDHSEEWVDIKEIEGEFHAEEKVNEWYISNGKSVYMEMDSPDPKWDGCEEDIKELGGIVENGYKMKESLWITEGYSDKDGFKRKAKFVFEKKTNPLFALYEGIGYEIVCD